VIVRQLSFVAEGDDWGKTELVRWLDGELHHGGAFAGLPKAQSQAWLLRVVDSLLTNRKAIFPILVRKRHELADVAIRRIFDPRPAASEGGCEPADCRPIARRL